MYKSSQYYTIDGACYLVTAQFRLRINNGGVNGTFNVYFHDQTPHIRPQLEFQNEQIATIGDIELHPGKYAIASDKGNIHIWKSYL